MTTPSATLTACLIMEKQLPLEAVKDEFRIWAQLAKPALDLPAAALMICEYGFTEMLNNVLDHSHGSHVNIRVEEDSQHVNMSIEDDGVGVLASLREHFGLDSDVHALIELVKGKLTTAPEAHSGEGLFFSSKMFDHFVLESGELSVTFAEDQCTVTPIPARQGTLIQMQLAKDTTKTTKLIFDQFCDAEDFVFYKTRFFLSLATLEGNLVSRSQAKRVAARFEAFSEVEIDCTGIEQIGQAFADELLRVWALKHPETHLHMTNTNPSVKKMISHIKGRSDLPQP